MQIIKSVCSKNTSRLVCLNCSRLGIFYGTDPFQKDSKKDQTEGQQKFQKMNELYKKFRDSQHFTIQERQQIRSKQTNEELVYQKKCEKSIEYYYEYMKYEQEMDENKFNEFLASVSNRELNKQVMTNQQLLEIIEQRANQLIRFKNNINLLNFVYFCSFQQIEVSEDVWIQFKNRILNNIDQLSFQESISLLNLIVEKNMAHFGEFFVMLENRVLNHLNQDERVDFTKIYQILEVYYQKKQGSKELFDSLETRVRNNMKYIKVDELIALLKHYSKNQNIKMDRKHEIIQMLEKKVIQMVQFFNCKELIQVIYFFQISQTFSKQIFEVLHERVNLMLFEFNVLQLEQLLVMYSTLDDKKPRNYMFQEIQKLITRNIDKYSWKNISQIFFVLSEQKQLSEQFSKESLNVLTKNIYQIDLEQMVKIVWSIVLQKQSEIGNVYFNKFKDIMIEKNLYSEMNCHQVGILVYSFNKFKSEDKEKDQEILDGLEKRVVELIDKCEIREIGQILWGYTNNVGISQETVDLIVQKVMQEDQQAEVWEISMIIWFFSKIDYENSNKVIQHYLNKLEQEDLFVECSLEQTILIMKSCCETDQGNQWLYQQFVDKVQQNVDELNLDETINCLFMMNIIKLKGVECSELIELLIQRYHSLQQLVVKDDQEDELMEQLRSGDFYEQNRMAQSIKKGQP